MPKSKLESYNALNIKIMAGLPPVFRCKTIRLVALLDEQRAGSGTVFRPCPPFQREYLFVNLHLMEHLDELGIAVVYDLAVADVQLRDLGHIRVTELEVPDVDVLLHALLVDRLGDDGDAALYVPVQGYLRCALAVLLADGGQDRVGKNTVVALGEGAPGLGMASFLTVTVCGDMGFTWQEGLSIVFICGLVNIAITLSNVRRLIIAAIPRSLQLAISGGIGLFLAFTTFLKTRRPRRVDAPVHPQRPWGADHRHRGHRPPGHPDGRDAHG